MNEAVKERWAAALDSGEYQQASRALRRAGGYCCLGVLCDLYRKQVGGEWMNYGSFMDETGDSDMFQLPKDVARWAGVDEVASVPGASQQGDHDGGWNYPTLADANDDGLPFPRIAQIIREKF